MKTRILLTVSMIGTIMGTLAQEPSITLTFTASYNFQYVPLDSIFIENITQGGDTTLYSPDSVLFLDLSTGFGRPKRAAKSFSLSQNNPNPFKEQTNINLNLPESDQVSITLRDIVGREMMRYENYLAQGFHSFTIFAGGEKYYLLTVNLKSGSKTIKMVSLPDATLSAGNCKIVHSENSGFTSDFKSVEAIAGLGFAIGDSLKFTGYAQTQDSIIGNNIITDKPETSTNYDFDILKGYRCPETPTLTDIDGNVYNTVLIGNQCWMKENLKTTTFSNGISIPNIPDPNEWQFLLSSGYVWYDNDISWKNKYGAMYNWFTTVDINGLCPTGWHVPDDEEWTALTDNIGGTGPPHGNELKSCRQVNSPLGGDCNTSEHPRFSEDDTNYGTDNYGFSGFPGGFRYGDGLFTAIGNYGNWWTSTQYTGNTTSAWFRYTGLGTGSVEVSIENRPFGFNVRCLKGELTSFTPSVETDSIFNIIQNSADAEGKILNLGSSDVIEHGHCWSTSQYPSINDFKTELGSATATGTFISNLTDLESETTYYIRAYAINDVGIVHGDVVNFTTSSSTGTGIPCPGMATVEDFEGNVYNTVLIGDQCWMKENLKTTTYNNGTPIPHVTDTNAWGNLSTGAYVWYDNDISWKDSYGALYNWYAMVDPNGLCPMGWHVPTNDEWTVLTDYIGGVIYPYGNKLKSCKQVNSPLGGDCNKTEHPRWNEYAQEWGTDDYGFSGLPGGYRNGNGFFDTIGSLGFWWSSTEGSPYTAWGHLLIYNVGSVVVFDGNKQDGFSVRCLRD